MFEDQEKKYRVWCFGVSREYLEYSSSYQAIGHGAVKLSIPNMDFSTSIEVTEGELAAIKTYVGSNFYLDKNPQVVFYQDLKLTDEKGVPKTEVQLLLENALELHKKNEDEKRKRQEKEEIKKIASEKRKLKKEKKLLESLKKKFE